MDQRSGHAITILLLITIFVPMIRLSRSGRIGLDLIFTFMLFSGAVATIRQKALMYLVVALTVIEFAADLIVEFNSSLAHLGWDTALKVSGLAILVVMTRRQTFRAGRVSVHRVMGGVAAYLLIGLTWGFGFKVLMEKRPDAIHFQSSIAGVQLANRARLIYFTFATLTSVSYGEAYPIHRIARCLAMVEALIGQLYPSILIATLVGMALQERSSVRLEAEPPKEGRPWQSVGTVGGSVRSACPIWTRHAGWHFGRRNACTGLRSGF